MVQLVVDSGCDLPDEFLRKFSIPVLPHTVSVGKDVFGDQRNPAQMAHFYTLSLVDRSHQIVTGPAPTPEIEGILQELVRKGQTDIVVQTINATNSPTYANALAAAENLAAGARGQSIRVHTVDTHSLFAGQGLLALYSLSLIRRGLDGSQVATRTEEFRRKVHGYAAIKDVYYVRARARSKNENSISWLKAMAARLLKLNPILSMHHEGSTVTDTVRGYDRCTERLFRLAADKIRGGELLMPSVMVSIAGKITDLDKVPGFEALQKAADEHDVKIYKSVMSLSGGINLGPGTVSLALASDQP
ncbi:DegV family protein [Microbulbifer yueqingensis]|uniref:EDD domain protein, DegV family n=1 Tax=Microbulbifer yueqingensis TaxID=658219 RepID=A0A1G9E3Z8_9GAMM|nr:DegV family protein [Microbulbifer yueqingensis]SDK70851.1 EDD domain protein, DegV family [Microbulbifer yueqingensis]